MWRLGLALLLVTTAATACVSSGDPAIRAPEGGRAPSPQAREVSGGIVSGPASRASLDEVQLAVPLTRDTRDGGECTPPLRIGNRPVLALQWRDEEGEVERTVTMSVDARGEPVSYSDLRGSLTHVQGRETSRPGTVINLSFRSGFASVENHTEAGAPPRFILVPFEEALHADQLDVPSRWMAELRERCSPD